MPELVTIPIAIFEITVEYARPVMKLLMDRKDVVDGLFEGFKPWGIKVDDIEVISVGKPSEQGVKFKLPTKRTSFFFGAASCTLTRDDSDWESAEETTAIFDIGVSTLRASAGVEVGVYKTAIALHLQPKSLQFIDLLRPFAPALLASLDSSPMKAVAAVTKWENRKVTIDGSGQLANGVFLRFEREFGKEETYAAIAAQLKADESQLFDLIGVKEDLP
jgi:hypothetical protein